MQNGKPQRTQPFPALLNPCSSHPLNPNLSFPLITVTVNPMEKNEKTFVPKSESQIYSDRKNSIGSASSLGKQFHSLSSFFFYSFLFRLFPFYSLNFNFFPSFFCILYFFVIYFFHTLTFSISLPFYFLSFFFASLNLRYHTVSFSSLIVKFINNLFYPILRK